MKPESYIKAEENFHAALETYLDAMIAARIATEAYNEAKAAFDAEIAAFVRAGS